MIIIWIRKSNRDEPSHYHENDGASFQKHDECMRRFRLAHPNVETTKSQDVKTADCLVLVPIPQVKLATYSQN